VVSNALTAINPQNSVPIDRVENKFRYSGNWRQVRGRHQWTAGFLVMRRQFNGYEGDAQLGGLQFNNNLGNDAITNLRLGLPAFLLHVDGGFAAPAGFSQLGQFLSCRGCVAGAPEVDRQLWGELAADHETGGGEPAE